MSAKQATEIAIKRLRVGDEQLGVLAAVTLKSEAEREGHEPSLAHMRDFLARDENYLIIASDGEKPIGFLVAYRMPQLARDANMIYLYEIGVADEYQRQGIARRLINLLKSCCKDDHVVEMWVGTSNDNIAAKRLYSSTGAELDDDHTVEFIYTQESLTASD